MNETLNIEERIKLIHHNLKKTSKILAAVVILIGILVLFGWNFNIEFLKRINPKTVAMNPLTATCFVLCGISILTLRSDEAEKNKDRLITITCSIIVLISCLSLFISLFTENRLPIDQVFFTKKLIGAEGKMSNTMAPNTAFNFILTSISLLTLEGKIRIGRKPAQYLITIVALVGLLSLYGYIYGVKKLYGFGAFIPMAMHTAFCFVLLALAVLFARPHQGLLGMLCSKGSAEILLLQFIAFFVPLIFGWLQLSGQKAGFYGSEFGTALFVILTYVISIFFLTRTSIISHKLDLEEKMRDELVYKSEQQLKAILNNIGEGVVVADQNGNFTAFNPVAKEILGIGAVDGPMASWIEKYGIFKTDEKTPMPASELPLPRALLGEKTDEVEMFVKNPQIPDGRRISVTGRPLKDSSGNITGGVVVFRNITEQKKMEKLIHENEKRLKTIISNIGEGIVSADTNGKFLLFNKKAEEILGIGPTMGSFKDWQKKYGVYLEDGVTPYPAEELPLIKAFKGEHTENVELVIRNHHFPQGKTLRVTGHPITDEDGKITAGVVNFHDITDIKILEHTLEDIQEKYYSILKKKFPGEDKEINNP